MGDTAIVGDTVEVIQTNQGGTAFSWNVAIAGALAAIAVSIILFALGTGIGLSFVSPYSASNPSAGTMTAIGAVWIIIVQSLAFATGGYMAGRLRTRSHIPGQETKFRDAAHGFMAWAIGVILFGLVAAGAGTFVTGQAAQLAATAATNAGALGDRGDYYVDMLFRPSAQAAGQAAQAPAPQQLGVGAPQSSAQAPAGQQRTDMQRDEVTRIFASSAREGKLSDDDKSYLSRMVAARTGLSEQEADRRVTETEAKAREAGKQAVEAARKAAAYASFWTFMSLLFGAMAAALGGILGGELRDEEWAAYRNERPVPAR